MTSRLVRLCVAIGSSALVSDALAQNPPAPVPPAPQNTAQPAPAEQPRSSIPVVGDPNEVVTLKVPDADIDTVITTLEGLTGRTVIRPQALQTATYNLTLKPLPKWKVIVAIETALAMNNIGIAPLGDDFIKMQNLNAISKEAPELITGSALELPASGRPAQKIFHLEFARSQEVLPLFTGLLNPFYGSITPLQNANAILVTDSVSNLQRVELMLQKIDRPVTSGMTPKFYQLKNGAKASDLVTKLRGILTPLLPQLGAATSFSADDRTNQVIVFTDPRQYAFFDELIDRLDQRSDPNTRNEVISLKHANAKEMVDVLTVIITGQSRALQSQGPGSVRPGQGMRQPQQPIPGVPTPPPGPTPAQIVSATNVANSVEGMQTNEFSPFMTVVNDERTNSVVVSGTVDDIRLLRELISKLDIVLAQVRIEVVIAEVTLSDSHSSGISELGLKVDGDKLVGFLGTSQSVAIRGPTGSTGDGPDRSFATITRPGTSGAWDLAGTISIGITPRKDNTAILSVPSITTSHAKEATVFVGETRPIITGSVNSGTTGGTTSTTTQQEIGINLTVTPLIGIDGSVQLEIEQDVDEVGPDIEIDGNPQPIIFKRNTKSFVSVKTGEIIVLGGLQRQSNTRVTNRLGPIPIIGDLLGSRSRSQGRTELLFFLRPYVLTNTTADNVPAMKRVDELPQKDAIKQYMDPSYVPPPQSKTKSMLDKILPK